jgi:branched-chain amino acid transport system substrate-binding protein
MTKPRESGPFPIFLAGLAALWLVTSCASRPTTPGPGHVPSTEVTRTKSIEPEARPMYYQAERAFNAKNYELAQKLFNQVKQKYPHTRADAFSSYRLGIIHYYRESYVVAAKDFDYFLKLAPQAEFAFDATYNWAAAEYQLGHYDRAYQILTRLKLSEVESQGPRRAEVVFQLTARIAAALNNHAGVIAANALEMQLPIEEATRTQLTASIDDRLNRLSDRSQLETLFNEVTEPATKGKISAKLSALNGPVSAPPTVEAAAPRPEVEGPATLSGSGSSGQRLSVGVLLPLSGRGATYGKRALDGILLASRIFSANPETDFRIYVEDTASNPLVAQSGLETLVKEREVVAVLGPLNWKEASAAGDKAQQMGVLNLSLTTKEGLSRRGPYLFQNALTPTVQLDSLVRFCITQKKLKRFAILAPKNAFGQDMSRAFWDMVDKYGGKISDYQTYAPDETDFREAVKQLTGLSNLKYRKLESAKLGEFIRDTKQKTGKEPKAQLPPVVDFDAVFIPDNPKTVAQIAPSLAYFDVNDVPLLGTTEWNSDQFYSRGGKYVEGAIFPGGLNLGTRNPTAQEFIRMYRDAYGAYPDMLAAQAFEAMQLIAAAVKNSGSGDRNGVVNQLSTLKDFDTPLGKITFDGDRLALRQLPILTLDNGGVITEHY